MSMPLYLLPLLILTVTLLIRAEFRGNRRQVYVVKPLSTLIVIAVVVLSFFRSDYNWLYSIGVFFGLLLSMGGDISLMFQQKRKAFMLGLVFFLLAHVVYTIVLLRMTVFTQWDILSAIILTLAAMLVYRLFKPNLGAMKGPVIAYIVVISVMVHRAAAALASPQFNPTAAGLVFTGALLFYISDVMLAMNKFWKPWRYNRISLAFYYAGQFLIALTANYTS